LLYFRASLVPKGIQCFERRKFMTEDGYYYILTNSPC